MCAMSPIVFEDPITLVAISLAHCIACGTRAAKSEASNGTQVPPLKGTSVAIVNTWAITGA